MISVAVRYEGQTDFASIDVLLKRLSKENGVEIEIIKTYPTGTSIEKFVYSTAVGCLEIEPVDLVVYFGDQDIHRSYKVRTKCLDIIRKLGQAYYEMSVMAIADRNFEAWLIADENNFKKLLSIKMPQQPLRETKDPKVCLKVYWSEWVNHEKPLLSETMKLLAETMDLNVVARNSPSFRKFREDFQNAVKLIGSKKG